jgi:hypothetical protein
MLGAGAALTCGLQPNGGLKCWNTILDSPLAYSGPFLGLTVADTNVCLLRADRTTQCMALGASTNFSFPRHLTFKQLALGSAIQCGLLENGAVRCWTSSGRDVLTVPRGSFQSIAAGGGQACALNSEGGLRCWTRTEDTTP